MKKHSIRYCPACGNPDLQFSIPAQDNLARYHCPRCLYIQYFNPIPVVGAILSWQGKVLICKRSIHPRIGLWTYPAGFMELNESIQVGAERECSEEANARCENMHLFAIYTLHREGQVHIVYRGDLVDGYASPGPESLETRLVYPHEIEADTLAFPIIQECFKLYVSDLQKNSFSLHQGSIIADGQGGWQSTIETSPAEIH